MATYSRRGLHGRVVHDIGVRILRGDLAPGGLLDVESLANDYDVSRTVVREALKVLSAKGLLDARPKRGTTVRPREHWNLLDPDIITWQFEGGPDASFIYALNEVRQLFEPAGARLAAARATAADIAAIGEAMATMRRHHGDIEAVTDDDLRLHRAILKATHNELLFRLETLIEAGLRVRHQLAFSINRESTYLDLHAAVVDAITRRQPDEAEAAMRSLVAAAGDDAARALREIRVPGAALDA